MARYPTLLAIVRHYSTHRPPLIRIPLTSVYNLGDAPSSSRNTGAKPILQDLQWTVYEGEAWAVVSSGSGKEAIFKTLLGHLRISPPPPPPGGLFPLLSLPPHTCDPYTSISLVSFRHHSGGPGGAFYDFTARYGAMRDDDQRITLLESMFPRFLDIRREREPEFAWQREQRDDCDSNQTATRNWEMEESVLTENERRLFKDLIERTGLRHLLDVPIVTLSNGQMRRARIVRAVLKKPELMLLDEPLTGLDRESRPRILELLRELHVAKQPRVIMGLRTQDEIPSWITHVAFVNNGKVQAGRKDDVVKSIQERVLADQQSAIPLSSAVRGNKKEGRIVVDIKNANIAYDNRKVLSNISWTIRLGDRWHLQGSNGSGKSTLLSLLTGAHPLSFSLPHLRLYDQKRARIPTPLIQSRIGEMSPELFDAFPRRMPGMTVWAVLGTGFEGTFIERGRESVGVSIEQGGLGIGIRENGTNELCWDGIKGEKWEEVKEWRIKRCWQVLQQLGPAAWDHGRSSDDVSQTTKEFAKRRFTELNRGEQRMVLVMRALVGRPPLVLLDEALSGMSDGMVRVVKKYLSQGGLGEDQALVAISHWEDELPFYGSCHVIRLE